MSNSYVLIGPMPRGGDIEERWGLLGEELYAAIAHEPNLMIIDEEWYSISVEECQGLVQRTFYEGHHPRFERTWLRGRHALQVFRTGGPT